MSLNDKPGCFPTLNEWNGPFVWKLSLFAKVSSSHTSKHDYLIRFLQMTHKSLWEPKIDTELAYAYTKTDCLHDIEDFLGIMNVTDIEVVGEKCFEDKLYLKLQSCSSLAFPTGPVLPLHLSTWARIRLLSRAPGKLAILSTYTDICCVSVMVMHTHRVWKQVHTACIKKTEFRLVSTVMVLVKYMLTELFLGANLWSQYHCIHHK
jgi:hypothetical protein